MGEIKDKILISIYEESKKDFPDMENNITAEKFKISYDNFKKILYQLSRIENYIDNALIQGKYPQYLVIKNIENMRLSASRLDYVQNIIKSSKSEKLNELNQLIDSIENLNACEKEEFKKIGNAISVEECDSKDLVHKIKSYLSRITGKCGEKIEDLIVQIASEAIIKAMKEYGMLPK